MTIDASDPVLHPQPEQVDEVRRRLVRAWCALKDDDKPRRPTRRALQEVEAAMEALDIPLGRP